jgi:hypothetical protein
LYEPRTLEAGTRYDVRTIIAPVPDAAGRVDLVLRLSQLPPEPTGAEVQRWVDLLGTAARAAAARVAADPGVTR